MPVTKLGPCQHLARAHSQITKVVAGMVSSCIRSVWADQDVIGLCWLCVFDSHKFWRAKMTRKPGN